jgi:hypothetical protein
VALKDNPEGMKQLAVEIYGLFNVTKTYGKGEEAAESAVRIFKRELADYPAELVQKALQTHIRRNPEFPTVADIVGLIERDGMPPFSEAMYINITKKQYYDRTQEERKYAKAYEAEQARSWGMNPFEDNEYQKQENKRLREANSHLQQEVARLADVIAAFKRERPAPLDTKKIELPRIEKTIEYLRQNGATDEQIAEFQLSMGAL